MLSSALNELWGKYSEKHKKIHRLIYHLIDVAETCDLLLQDVLPSETRRSFQEALSLDEKSSITSIKYLAALHDIGKVSPAFQQKIQEQKKILIQAGLDFPVFNGENSRHGVMSAFFLRRYFQISGFTTNPQNASRIAKIIGGHHGSWPTAIQMTPPGLTSAHKGGENWEKLRNYLAAQLCSQYQPAKSITLTNNEQQLNAFLIMLAGLISVSDWIGSIDEYFTFRDETIPLGDYQKIAQRQARMALKMINFQGYQDHRKHRTFYELFPQFTPNPTQLEIIKTTTAPSNPFLAILEAPTGIGKTEIAFMLADYAIHSLDEKGFYIAMPTQATSNQMYQRATEFLKANYKNNRNGLLLLHSAAFPEDLPAIQEDLINSDEQEGASLDWFLPKKRAFLNPFAVGTVDQSFLGVLQTRHFFVRLFGLSNKVIIFDEIHAYDTYMATLFDRLLMWLRALGCSVILLTATLPKATKMRLLTDWNGNQQDSFHLPYPSLLLVQKDETKAIALPSGQQKVITIQHIDMQPESIVQTLKGLLEEGGCAAVICNRVDRAQKVYETLKQAGITEEMHLLHSRFPRNWREQIEAKILARFGKNESLRPHKAIVVSTQILEQSLDLDFDVMISDYAPVDLIIQRVGRMHRHLIKKRPAACIKPTLYLCQPAFNNEVPDFGSDEWIYDKAILLKTWRELHDRKTLQLPAETEYLIERVYTLDIFDHQMGENFKFALQQAIKDLESKRANEEMAALQRLIPEPTTNDLTASRQGNLEEDDPEVHQVFRAMTRLIEESISLICLFKTSDEYDAEINDLRVKVNVNRQPDKETTKNLLAMSLHLQQKQVVWHFRKKGKIPWHKSRALKNHYLAEFNEAGACRMEGSGYSLLLNREMGVVIKKEVL